MKIIKGIGLFFVYPLIMVGVGIYIGFKAEQFFYPGDSNVTEDMEGIVLQEIVDEEADAGIISGEAIAYGVSRAVAAVEESLCVDTEYVLREMDLFAGTMEETTYKIPTKYVGMTREQFLDAMDSYELSPPLAELERGFVDLEVLSFSREKVVILMNYRFVQPGDGFYLAVYDNKVVVYLEDKTTIYIETDIMLESLPADLQKSVMKMHWMGNEAELFDFLESYSS